MSEETFTPAETQEQSQSDSGGINHSWDPVLNLIPEDVRDQATPYFQQWDQGVQQKFQGIHEQYKPWKQFIDNGVNPEDAQYSLGLMNALQEDPRKVWEALGQHYNFMAEAAQQQQPEGLEGNEPQNQSDPELADLRNTVTTMADILLRQQREREAAAEDAALDKHLKELKGKYGAFDEDYVLGKMQAGWKAEDAVKSYKEFVDRVMNGSRPEPPRVFGSGGAIPTAGGVDVRKMNSADTKKLVVDYLRSSQQPG